VKGLSIADVLALPVARAAEVFRDLPRAGGPLRSADDVGLGYVVLGDPTSRLSGGEALRLRLASALGRGGRIRTLYLLDEPSAGLHPDDVLHLRDVLLRLSEANAVVVVDHHPLFVRAADHAILLGPGPAERGGRLVYEGPPSGLP
jgi:excinuclease ABC subunit A